ncbi:hypothetical protein Tco_0698876 [Tanacetum coccineum]
MKSPSFALGICSNLMFVWAFCDLGYGAFGYEFIELVKHILYKNIGERNVAKEEVKLLTLIEVRVVPLVPPAPAASGGSNNSIDKLFDDGNDAEQEYPIERDDNVLAETIAKDVSEVVVEKTKKFKQKRKTIGDASGSTLPPKKPREDYHAATSNISGKSLAAIRGLILEGSSVSSEVTGPRIVVSVTPTPDCKELYTEFNVGAARQICLGAEVRMRAKHTLEQKDKLEDKCAEQAALLSEKDAEIANLKSLLSLKEAEAAIRLCGQLSVVEAADAAKGNELKSLKENNLALEEEKNVFFERQNIIN